MKPKIAIGSRYQETKGAIIQGLNDGTLQSLETIAKNHACYFCERRIEGVMYEIRQREERNGIEIEGRFFLDRSCYEGCTPQEIIYN